MENSKIGWTDNTFNIAEGCMKVSDGCKNCYAETRDKQYHEGSHWGPNTPRRQMSEKYWLKPLMWQKKAAAAGVKTKVFCSSLCDVFEDHPDLVNPRNRLFELIEQTPNLIWQLLTKRPENIVNMIPGEWITKGWPLNVWMGTTAENQNTLMERLPHLLDTNAAFKFLSCEPLLGPLDFSIFEIDIFIDWVIVGGESGSGARPMHPDWARSIRDRCKAAGVPFFFKQWGEYIVPQDGSRSCRVCGCTEYNACEGQCSWVADDLCSKCIGKDIPSGDRPVKYRKVGKHNAGEMLDGVEIKEFPLF